ncbi:MAG TPA: hydroxypyruvate isomerase, partial [Gammaproteobacteria bacterium]|nr:hydroxypyruvate isomerase [Gammaproteobacteria bacterium]
MLNFAANLSMLFVEHSFLDRFSAAAAAGFTAVECQFPYDHSPEDLGECLHSTGLELILLNFPAGDLTTGERGLAAFPDRLAQCREQIDYGLDFAVRLGCPR